MKKQLTRKEEFEILKLVLDKILWMGFLIMAFGLYNTLTERILEGIYYIVAGLIILLLFIMLIVREYEIVKSNKK